MGLNKYNAFILRFLSVQKAPKVRIFLLSIVVLDNFATQPWHLLQIL